MLADATGQEVSGEQEAFDFWNDNLANAKRIEGDGFVIEQFAFLVSEGRLLEDVLSSLAKWLEVFL